MTRRLAIALIFAGSWVLITGSWSVPNVLFGLFIGGVALFIIRHTRGETISSVRPLKLIRLILLFFVELMKSGFRVARLALQRDLQLDPGIVRVPLTLTRDFDIALLANLITLTPGTLTVDVSDDRDALLVHCVAVGDPDAVIADIKNGFERAIREAFP